jgi:O-antigen polysaccharide polymerase Wzy
MSSASSYLALALFGQLLVWLAVVQIFLMTRQASLYHPLSVYLLFHGLAFVGRPFLVYYLDFDREWQYMLFEPTAAQFIYALAASSFALIVFAAASLTFGWCKTEFTTPATEPFTQQQIYALAILTVVLLPLIGYSIKSLYTGGLQIENRGSTYVMVGDSGYTLEAQYMAGPLLCAWLVVKRFRWPALVPMVPYLAYRVYTGGSRWTIVLLFLVIALVYAWQKRSKWPPLWAVGCAIPVFLLFKTIGDNRHFLEQYLEGQPVEHVAATQADWKTKYDNPDFANFDYLTFVMAAVPERTGVYTYGAQYLQLFTEPVPRKLWPGKPVGAPVRLFNLNNYGNFLGLTVSIVGDGWMSGGWLGIAVTMAIVGAILGRAHRWFWKNSAFNIPCLFYLVGLAMLPQWFRDGGISIAKFLFWNLIPLILWVAATWATNGCHFPVHSVLLRPGTKLRFVRRAVR